MDMSARVRVVAAIAVVGCAVLWESAASAQPYAYVLGQRDDPAPGNQGIQAVTIIAVATNTKVTDAL